MFTLRSVCERVPPVGPTATIAQARARFFEAPDLRLLPVVNGDAVLGLLQRHELVDLALPPAMMIETLVTGSTPMFDAGEDARALNTRLVSAGEATPLQGFVVLDRGAYFGCGDGLTLLRSESDHGAWQRKLIASTRREMEIPLGGLLAVAQLLGRQPLSNDASAQLRAITSAAEDALSVLAEVSAHLDPEASRSAPARQEACLTTLLDEVDALWQGQASQRGVRLVTSARVDAEHRVRVDPERFRTVLNALIDEAMTVSVGGVVEARLTAERDGGVVRTQVRVQAAAPFTEAGAAALTPGPTPSGLSGARLLAAVRGLEGRLRRGRNEGGGLVTTLELALPLVQDRVDPSAGGRDRALGHILIVDDNATNRLVAEALCTSFGFTAETADSGEAAVDAARLRGFDLVLMDIKMPGMNGVEATRAIHAMPGHAARMPIVALTANADPEAVAGYLAAGMQGVVEKPIKPDALFAAITAALSQDAAPASLSAAAA